MTHPHLKRFYLKPTIEQVGAGDNFEENLMTTIDTIVSAINGDNNEQTEDNLSGETGTSTEE